MDPVPAQKLTVPGIEVVEKTSKLAPRSVETIPQTSKSVKGGDKKKKKKEDKKIKTPVKLNVVDKTEKITELHPVKTTTDTLTTKADQNEELFIEEVEKIHGLV